MPRSQRQFEVPNLRLFDAPVFLHWTLLIVLVPVALVIISNPISGLITSLSYFAIITIHEIGHALFAKQQNCRVIEIQIGAIHGYCKYERPLEGHKEYLIAWGGAIAQLIVGVPLIVLSSFFFGNSSAFDTLAGGCSSWLLQPIYCFLQLAASTWA